MKQKKRILTRFIVAGEYANNVNCVTIKTVVSRVYAACRYTDFSVVM